MPPSDVELLRECARGSRDALGVLYDRHAARMLAVAVRILKSHREAEDILHDVFLETWSHAGDYDPERASVKTWLYLRLRSRCLDRVRSAAHTRLADEPQESAGAPPDSARIGDAGRVLALLEALPEEQRDVLILSYFQGLSMTEIAERLSIPVGTVKSRAGRGLARLKEGFAEEESAP